MHVSNLNHLQRSQILRLSIVPFPKLVRSDSQFLQTAAILHREGVIRPFIAVETIHSNPDALQIVHFNHIHCRYIPETVISHDQRREVFKARQVQFRDTIIVIATAIRYNNRFCRGIQGIQFLPRMNIGGSRRRNDVRMSCQFTNVYSFKHD